MLENIYKETKDKMQVVLNVLRDDFSGIRTGRASISILEKVKVPCYNSMLPLNQVATISVSDPHMMTVQPWDKTLIAEIEKAILTSDLGLSPLNDSNILRVPIPPLSTERRQDLIKIMKKKSEDGKVAIRNVRRDCNDKVKKIENEKTISEDESKMAHEKIQKMTDEFIKLIDEMSKNKEKEIMEI